MANPTGDLNEHGDQFAEAVHEYLSKAYDSDRRRQLIEAGGWDPAFAAELTELGWYQLAVPEEHDGLGADLDALGPVFAQLGRHLVAGPQLESFLLPALLPQTATFRTTPAAGLALVDPGVTEDWSAALGSVTLTRGRLDGTAQAVRFAPQAQVLIVIAESADGEVVCIVDPESPGVSVEEVASTDPAAAYGRVVLTDVEPQGLPAGGEDDLVVRVRAWARLLLACELSGLAHRSLELTVAYIGQREQFGRPIGSFQALKHIAADMHVTWAGLDSVWRAAVADAARVSGAELEMLGMTAKAHAADAAIRVCENAIQLHGGMGFTSEADVSWYYRRALALRAWYGDADELQRRVGATILDRPEPQTRDEEDNDEGDKVRP